MFCCRYEFGVLISEFRLFLASRNLGTIFVSYFHNIFSIQWYLIIYDLIHIRHLKMLAGQDFELSLIFRMRYVISYAYYKIFSMSVACQICPDFESFLISFIRYANIL